MDGLSMLKQPQEFLKYCIGLSVMYDGTICKLFGVHVEYSVIEFPGAGLIKIPRRDLGKIKPILRSITDMTPDECLEICQIASPTAWGDYRFKKWVAKLDPKSNDKSWKAYDVTNENSPYSFVVDLIDGDVMLYDEGDNDLALMNHNYRFWYILNAFDILGLIKEGKAIDNSKI